MECKVCHNKFVHTLDTWCLEKTGRCVDCQKKWTEQPENDPDMKEFVVEYVLKDEATIYAPNIEEAEIKFSNDYCGEFSDINDIREIKK